MSERPSTDSPLAAVTTSERATQAFALLSDETRLAILVALWEAFEPFDETNSLRFSELRSRVPSTDSGQFNYHLDRLAGHFIESGDDGYHLTNAGLKIVRSVIAGAGIEDPTIGPSEVDATCTLCGGDVRVLYEQGWVYILCTDCDGVWPGDSDHPHGLLAKLSLDPAGLVDRSPADIYAAAWVRSFQHLYSMIEGVCPTCSGPVERELEYCADHEPEGTCSNCGRRLQTIARFRCSVCKDWEKTTIGGVAKYHPRIVAFCYAHDLTLQYGFNDLDHIKDRLTRADSQVERVSEHPLRIRVTTTIDEDGAWIELDENLAVVDVEEFSPG